MNPATSGRKPLIRPSVSRARLESLCKRSLTAFQRAHGLHRCNGRTVKRVRKVIRFGCFQPHHVHVMHVRYDGCDCPALAVREFRTPCFRRQIFDQVQADAIICVECVQ
jgi:hypothetical protein